MNTTRERAKAAVIEAYWTVMDSAEPFTGPAGWPDGFCAARTRYGRCVDEATVWVTTSRRVQAREGGRYVYSYKPLTRQTCKRHATMLAQHAAADAGMRHGVRYAPADAGKIAREARKRGEA